MEELKTILAEIKKIEDSAVAKINALEAKIEDKTKLIDELKSKITAETDKIRADISKGGLKLPGLEEEVKRGKVTLTRTLRGLLLNDWTGCEAELEAVTECKKKNMQLQEIVNKAPGQYATQGQAGGAFIPIEVSSIVVPLAFARTPIMQLGVTKLDNLSSNITLPKVLTRGTGYWMGENAVPTAQSAATFGQINLNPKRLAVYDRISNQLLLQAPEVAEKILMEQLSLSISLKLHSTMLYGTGTQYQPKGIFNHSITSSTAIGASGGRFKLTHAIAMQKDIDNADLLVDSGKFAYIMHPIVKWGMRDERITMYSGAAANSGMPINWFNGMNDKGLEDFLGYPFKTTTQIAKTSTKGNSTTCSDVVFGDFANFYVATWAGMTVKKTDQATDANGNSAWLQDETWIMLQLQTDWVIGNEAAFTQINDAETTSANW
jgi:HK97 family phage major capsid protein